MSSAAQYDFRADQGSTLSKVFTYQDSTGTPVDLTGYSARMQLRTEPDSTTVILELTTGNGRISLGGVAGTITLDVLATDMTFYGTYVYDLELVTGTTVTSLIYGQIVIRPEVTR